MKVENKTVLVIGTGMSGIGAAELLSKVHANPVLFDSNDTLDKDAIRKKLPEGTEVEIVLGALSEEVKSRISLVVISPGVPVDSELVEAFRGMGIPVWGEIELAYQFAKGDVLAVTGTNGKTTTTSLLGQIMQDYFKSVYVVGNIGNPYTKIALDTKEDTVTVAEISSFQLETIHTFHPSVSAILNITPDHLNRHHTMENYVAVKEAIAMNQTEKDTCVLNYEDDNTRAFGKETKAKVIYFSSKRVLEKGIYLKEDDIYYGDGTGTPLKLMNIHSMKLIGTHNVENVMAAIAMASACGVPMEDIIATVQEFKAVEHRIEFVAMKKGVDYYNDSKGTNPDAAIKGIKAMRKPTILIGGGYDKQSEYDEWVEAFDGKVKYLILMGQTREKIAECARKHGFVNIIFAESLEEVMKICEEKAEPGDAVLLSPACASWGMFPNYEIRGKMFKDIVNNMKE
ncbi:MAG: UDP-N-acetylmuramoyl-L-alanine--D-glutamate ligase [Lachnospiraceae bacterium]|nr:UDP-N-acetylmuramoyl-L-alanine--D-glutamate ligase [Lachnospiraceae bacterium]